MSIEKNDESQSPDKDKFSSRYLTESFIKATGVDQLSEKPLISDQHREARQNSFIQWLLSKGYQKEQIDQLKIQDHADLLREYQRIQKETKKLRSSINPDEKSNNSPHPDNNNYYSQSKNHQIKTGELDETFVSMSNRPKQKEDLAKRLDRTSKIEAELFNGEKIDWAAPITPPTALDRVKDAFTAFADYLGLTDSKENDPKSNN